MILKLLIIVGIALLGFTIAAAMRPSEFRISRSALMSAPPDVVFPHVNELRNWEAWSPWAKLDPKATTSYEGPQSGTGAAFAWAGNQKIGEGRMTIIESLPSQSIRFRLDFKKPFKGTNTADFDFMPENGQTRVTWTMSGHSAFIPKVIGMFINCDKMVGDQFEKGLADLNKACGEVVRR
ncbi:MAG TPA: SRPBCC family protein [Verrucomicrobiae bacterium]|jgi:hypothetical protein|nr:SRPBCC family protein [Verrucomicrobiae bacterium]